VTDCRFLCHLHAHFDTVFGLSEAIEAEEHSSLHFDGSLFIYRRAPRIALCLVFCHCFDAAVQLSVANDSAEKYLLHFDAFGFVWYRPSAISFFCFSSSILCANITCTCHSMKMFSYLPTNEASLLLYPSRTVHTLRDIDVSVSPGPLLLLNSGTN
jgi:hypothetical protein